MTGGWPRLVERAVALALELESEDAALVEMERTLATPNGAADFVESTGLTADDQLAAAFDHITALVDTGASLADLLDAASMAEHPDADAAVSSLDALGVFDVADDGAYRVEPLLVRCWPYRAVPADV